MERWEIIPDYGGAYEVSSHGRVRSFKGEVPRILKQSLHKKVGGYLKVSLRSNGQTNKAYVHRLVANSFCTNNLKLEQVNHENGIKTDNRAVNLVWVTQEENMQHAVQTGLIKKGNESCNYKGDIECYLDGVLQGVLQSPIEMISLGFSPGNVYAVVNNRNRVTHNNHTFRRI